MDFTSKSVKAGSSEPDSSCLPNQSTTSAVSGAEGKQKIGQESDKWCGRTPSMDPANLLIANCSNYYGPTAKQMVRQALGKLGLDKVLDIWDRGQFKKALPFGADAVASPKRQVYRAGSREIRKDEVRRICDDAYRNHGKDVVW